MNRCKIMCISDDKYLVNRNSDIYKNIQGYWLLFSN